MRLDGNAALLFQVHGIQHLRAHLAGRQSFAVLDKPIGQRRFTVVDVRDDREVAYVFHQYLCTKPHAGAMQLSSQSAILEMGF
jgi:hypothetical protein